LTLFWSIVIPMSALVLEPPIRILADVQSHSIATTESDAASEVPTPYSPKSPVPKGSCDGQTFLVYFLHRLLDFRRPEFEAVAELCGVKGSQMSWHAPVGGDELSPFWYVTLPDEAVVKKICSRALLTKVGC
jgi:hypothetical protein